MQLESLSRLLALVSFSVASALSLSAASSDLDTGFVSTIGAGLTPENYPDTNHNTGTGAANAVALQSDGKIIVGGNISKYNNTGELTPLKRLLPTGALDASFNSSGSGLSVFTGQPEVNALLVASDNKIYVGGTFASYNETPRSGILRLNADGSLDTDFAPSGLTGINRYAQTLALQVDGKLLVGGTFTGINGVSRKHLARLDSTGAIDESFNPDAALAAATSIRDLAIQPDGKIIVAGTQLFNFSNGTFLVRLNADGSLDASFAHPFANAFGSAGPIALLPDGRLVVAGFLTLAATGEDTNLVGLNADGSLDTAFNTNLGAGPEGTVIDLLVQPDGTLLAGGIFKSWDDQPRASVARVNFDGTLDGSFAPAPYRTDNAYGTHFNSLAVQADGKLLAGGWFSRVTNPALETFNLTRFVNEFSASDPGALRLLSATATTAENAGSITLHVSRFGGLSGAVSVSYATSTGGTAGTAIANSDYTTTTGTLHWAAGEGGFKTITVPILQDSAAESSETFSLTLSSPTGGATLPASKAKTVVTLRDDESAPIITRQPASVSLEQGASFTLSVGYDSVLPVTIQWQRDPDGAGSLPFENISAATATRYTVANGNPDTHAGTYRAVLTSTAGATNSNTATVSISVPAGSVDLTTFTSTLTGGIVKAVRDSAGRYVVATATTVYRLTSAGTVDATFTTVTASNAINDLLILDDGKILVAGFFDTVNGTARKGLARLNTDGTLDTAFNLALTHHVRSLAMGANGKLYVGGTGNASGLKRFTSAGVLDSAFGTAGVAPDIATNVNGSVHAVQELTDGRILVSHQTGFSLQYRFQLLSSLGVVDTSFSVPALNWNILAWDILPDGRIAVGGSFSTIDGKSAARLAILNTSGSVDTTFQVGTGPNGGWVTGVRYLHGRLLAWGDFTTVNGSAPRGLARFNLDGSLDTSFSIGAGASTSVSELIVTPAGNFDIFGDFTTFKGVPRSFAARLVGNPHIGAIGFAPSRVTAIENPDVVTLTLRRYGPATEPVSITYATADGTGVAGTDYLAASGTVFWPAGNSADKTIHISLVNDTVVEASTTFRVVLGTTSGPATGAASATITLLDDDTPVIFTTQPTGPGSALFAGGSLNLTGTVVSSPTPVTYQWFLNGVAIPGATSATYTKNPISADDAGLYTLVVTNSAGSFSSSIIHVVVAPQPGRAAPGQAVSGRPSFIGSGVQSIVPLSDGGALIGGGFNQNIGNNVPQYYLLRVKADGSTDTSFTPSFDSWVRALVAQPDGKILVVGDFTLVNGATQRYLYRYNADLTPDTAFNSAVATAVPAFSWGAPYDVTLDSLGRIYLGFSNGSSGSVWRFSSTGVVDDAYTLTTSTVSFSGGGVTALAMQSDDKLLVGGNFTRLKRFSDVANTDKNRLARVNTDGSIDTGFTASLGTLPISDLLVTSTGRIFVAGGTGSGTNLVEVSASDGTTLTGGSSGRLIYEIAFGPDGRLALARGSSDGTGSISRLNIPVGATTSNDTTFSVGSGPNTDVTALAYTPDGSLWIAGNFTAFDGFTSGGVVKLQGSASDPGIVNQPLTTGVNQGGTARFSVGAFGTGLSYQWLKNDEPLVDDGRITGATTAILKITNAEESDAADYTVAVTGTASLDPVISSPAHLHLVAAPIVLSSPSSVTLSSVGTVKLTAKILAATPASYVWTRNGVVLLNGGRYSGANTATLTITGANSMDNGAYTLTVTNDLGTAATTPATVVAPSNGSSALGFSTHPTGGLFNLGDTVQLTAAANGNNGFVYQWKKAGVPLSNNARYSGVNTATLTITNIAASNAGDYTVTATTPATSATSNAATVAVLAAPEFTAHPESAIRALGGSVTLSATARGIGTLTYQWYQGATPLANGSGISGATTASLTLTNLSFAHAGTYTVRATNSLGNATSDAATLTIERRPDTAAAVNQPSFNGSVHAIQFLSDGSYLVGGAFTSVTLNGTTTSRNRLVRINADGTLDTAFAPSFNGDIRALAVDDDGRIFVGGSFTTVTVGSTTSNRLRVARFTAARALDSGFNTSAGPGGDVYALAPVGDGSVYVGGSFFSVGSVFTDITCLARLKTNGALDTAFKSGANSTVNALLLRSDGKLYVGGGFSNWGTASAPGLVLVSPTGTRDSNFASPLIFTDVRTLRMLGDGKLLAGGTYYFGFYTYLKKLNPGTGAELPFVAPGSATINAFAQQADDKILIGTQTGFVLRTSDTGTTDDTFAPTSGFSAVRALAIDAKGRIYVGGEFTTFNGVTSNRFAILNGGATKSVSDPADALESQTLTFPALANRAFTTAPIAISATASSGLPVAFSVVSGNASVSGSTLTLTGLGNVTVEASQAGNGTYAPASTTRTFTVTKASQTITFATIPAKTRPTPAFTVSATASSGLPVTIAVVSGPATVSGKTVTLTGTGSVTLRATQLGNATFNAAPGVDRTFTVNSKPIITTQPKPATVVLGTAATFKVVATGTGPLTYQWRRNGANIAGATSPTFTIAKTASTHAGDYSVVVQNSLGTATSANAKLAFGTKPVITKQPVARTVTEFGSATFSVTANGSPAVTYQWRRNGANITGATSASYTVSGATFAKAGDYTVEVKNTVGSVISTIAKLTVNPANAPASLVVGHDLTLTGTTVDSVNGSGPDSATLTISSGTTFAGGTYTYTRNTATTATLTYEAIAEEADFTESETGTFLLTFTSRTGGTYTSSGSFEGTDDNAGDYSGTFTGSGTFTLQP